MLWVAVWTVLVLGAAGVLFVVGRSVFRQGMALVRELGEASEQLAAVTAQLEQLRPPARTEDPAVFADPAELRRRRDREARERARQRRKARARRQRVTR